MGRFDIKLVSFKRVAMRFGMAAALLVLASGGVHADPGLKDALFPKIEELKVFADEVLPSRKNEHSWVVKNPDGKVAEHSRLRIKTSNGWTPIGFAGLSKLTSDLAEFKKKIEAASVDRVNEVDQILAQHLKKLIAEERAEKTRMDALRREFSAHDESANRQNFPDNSDYIEPLITESSPVCNRADDHCFPSECTLTPGMDDGDASNEKSPSDCVKVLTPAPGAPTGAAAAPVAASVKPNGTKASRLWDSYRAKREELERIKLSRLAEVVEEYFSLQKRVYENFLGNAHNHARFEHVFDRTAYNHLNLKLDGRFAAFLKSSETLRLKFNLWFPKSAYEKDNFAKVELGLTAQDRSEIEESVLKTPTDEYSYRKLMQLLVARERIANWWGIARSIDQHYVEAPGESCAEHLVTLKSESKVGSEMDPSSFGYAQHLWSEDNLNDFRYRFVRVLGTNKKAPLHLAFKNYVSNVPPIAYTELKPLILQFFTEFDSWKNNDVYKAGAGTLEKELAASTAGLKDPAEIEAMNRENAKFLEDAKKSWSDTYAGIDAWASDTQVLAGLLFEDMRPMFETLNGPGEVNHVPMMFAQRLSWGAYRYWLDQLTTVFVGAAINNGAVDICELLETSAAGVETTQAAQPTQGCVTYSRAREVAQSFVSSKMEAKAVAWRRGFKESLLTSVYSPEVTKTVGNIKTRRRLEIMEAITPPLDAAGRAAVIATRAKAVVVDEVTRVKEASRKLGFLINKNPKEELEWLIPFVSQERLKALSAKDLRSFFSEKLKRLNLWNEETDPVVYLFPPDYASDMKFSTAFQREQARIQSDPLVMKYMELLFLRIDEKFLASLTSHVQSKMRSKKDATADDLDPELVQKSFDIAIARSLPEIYQEFIRELTGVIARPDPKTASAKYVPPTDAPRILMELGTGPTKEKAAKLVRKDPEKDEKVNKVPVPARLVKAKPEETKDHSIQKNPALGGFEQRVSTFMAALAVMNLSGELRERIGGKPFDYNKNLKMLVMAVSPYAYKWVFFPPKSKDPINTLLYVDHMEEIEQLSLDSYVKASGGKRPRLSERLFMSTGDQRTLAEVTYQAAENSHPLLSIQGSGKGDPTDLRSEDLSLMRRVLFAEDIELKFFSQVVGKRLIYKSPDKLTAHEMLVRMFRIAAANLKGKISEVCTANPVPNDPLDPKFVSFFSPRFETNLRLLVRASNPEFSNLDKLTVRKTRYAIENWFEDNARLMKVLGAIFGIMMFFIAPKFAGGLRSFLSLGKWSTGFQGTKSAFGFFEALAKLSATPGLQKLKLLGFINHISQGMIFGTASVLFLLNSFVLGYVNVIVMPPQLKYQIGMANTGVEKGIYGEVSHERVREFETMLSDSQKSASFDILTQLIFAPMALSPFKQAIRQVRGWSVSRALKNMEIPGVSTEAVKNLRQPSLRDRVAARGGGLKGAVSGAADQAAFKVNSILKYGRTIGMIPPESVSALTKNLNEVLLPSLNQAVGGRAGMVDVVSMRISRLKREIDRTKKVILNIVKRQNNPNLFGDYGNAQNLLSIPFSWRFPSWMRSWTESFTGFNKLITGFLRYEYRVLLGMRETQVYQLGMRYKSILRDFSNPRNKLGAAKASAGATEAHGLGEFEHAVYDARTRSAGFWDDAFDVAAKDHAFPLRTQVWDGQSWTETMLASEAELSALQSSGQKVRYFNKATHDPDIGWGRWRETGRMDWHPGVDGSVLVPGNVYRVKNSYRGWTGDGWIKLETEGHLKKFLGRYSNVGQPEFLVFQDPMAQQSNGTFTGGTQWFDATDDFAAYATKMAELRHLTRPLTLTEERILMLHAQNVLLQAEVLKAEAMLNGLQSNTPLIGLDDIQPGVAKYTNGEPPPPGYSFTSEDWMTMRESIGSALKETSVFDVQYLAFKFRPKMFGNLVSDAAGLVGVNYSPAWSQRGNLQQFKRRFDMIMDELNATQAWNVVPPKPAPPAPGPQGPPAQIRAPFQQLKAHDANAPDDIFRFSDNSVGGSH